MLERTLLKGFTMRRLWLAVFLLACSPGYAQQVPRDPIAGNVAGTPVAAVFTGADTTTQNVALAGVANKTTYICGISVTGLGATGLTAISVTVASIAPGVTLTFQYVMPAGATVQSTPLAVNFSMCLPASATGTAITVTVPGAAGNTATQINAWGYQL
jgi:hypothetical protein